MSDTYRWTIAVGTSEVTVAPQADGRVRVTVNQSTKRASAYMSPDNALRLREYIGAAVMAARDEEPIP